MRSPLPSVRSLKLKDNLVQTTRVSRAWRGPVPFYPHLTVERSPFLFILFITRLLNIKIGCGESPSLAARPAPL